jgi:hypothetical protein
MATRSAGAASCGKEIFCNGLAIKKQGSEVESVAPAAESTAPFPAVSSVNEGNRSA